MFDPAHPHRDVTKWPRLLVGPILRRVTATSVAVFVAASESVTVTLTVHDGVATPRSPVGASAQRDTVDLGTKLHVCVVEATGLQLEPGHLYGYDIQLEKDGDVEGLERLLHAPVPLGYVDGDLPGFVLPGPLDSLRIVHGSCRKPHGCVHASLVDPDALPLVDRMVQDSRTDPFNRPQQLLLTGDQIYADDVPAALLAAITSAGALLLGWQEQLVDKDGAAIAHGDPTLAPGTRSQWLHDQGVKDRPDGAEGWEDYAANHLLFLADWCAMYVFAWSPELWLTVDDAFGTAFRTNLPDAFYHHLSPATDLVAKAVDTTTPTLVYAQSLEFVRRALANVPTYMLFDDHDVTDDWFLNRKVDDQLRGRGDTPGPVGRRLMRNALASYAVFQHWGNRPEDFEAGTPGGDLLDLLHGPSGAPPLAATPDAADVLLDVGAQPVGPDRHEERMRWDWDLVFDEHRLIALDTRTWRGYPTGPRPPTANEVRDAADTGADDLPFEWGPTALDGVGSMWVDTAAPLTGPIADLLTFGGDAILASAALARIGESLVGDHRGVADDVRALVAAMLDVLAVAPATASHSWAVDALADAATAMGSAGYGPTGDVVETVLRVATALHEGAFIVRAAVDGAVAAIEAEDLYDEVGFLTAVEATADLLTASAGFLEGAVYAVARAARDALRMVDAWGLLAVDSAELLWGAAGTAAQGDLWQAAMDSAPFRADLAEAVEEFAASPDPVRAVVDDADRRRNAQLIGGEAMVFQVHDRVWATQDRRELTVVVSPAPVFGHDLVEWAQRLKALTSSAAEPDEEWENEPWSGNAPALHRLLDALAPLGQLVVLSGDVHYAYSTVTDYEASDGTIARFVQFTSSPMKNSWAPSRALEFLDDHTSNKGPGEHLQFDVLETLPPQSDWDEVDAAIRELLPSREQALEFIEDHREQAARAAGDHAGPGSWLSGMLDRLSLRDALSRPSTSEWDTARQDSALRTADELESIGRTAGNPMTAFVGDRAHAASDNRQLLLALGDELRVDPRWLPSQLTSVLQDPRRFERAGDSPGLAARVATRSMLAGMRLLLSGRRTVGHDTIGVVTTQATARGRFVTHELYWFPFDTPDHTIQPDAPGASSRDDWIITRHVAGLTQGTPRNGALYSPAPTTPISGPDPWILVDVTSPGHVQVGARRIHGITDAAPTMPDLTVTARMLGLAPQQDATQVRAIRMECHYEEGGRTDVVHLPGPDATHWQVLAAGDAVWRPVLPAGFFGGDLQAFARADVDGVDDTVTGQTLAGTHAIWGRNPSKGDIRAHAASVAGPDLATNMDVMFHRESHFTQFAASAAHLGPWVSGPATVLRSPDTAAGTGSSFGAGQLDPPPSIHHMWHWRANVEESVARLTAARADALTYQRQVQEGLPWDAATGTFDHDDPDDPPPPDEGVPQAAPAFTADQFDLEMWSRYNGRRRFHDWDGSAWVRQPSTNTSVTTYAPALLASRRAVDAGTLPGGW